MDFARQFLNIGIKKVFTLLLSYSFLQDLCCHSPSTYQQFPSYCFPSNTTQVTVPRTALQCFTKTVCNFCFGKCLFWSCMLKRVLHSRQHYRHKYQLFKKSDKVLVTSVFTASKQSLFFYVNVPQCNARMPHHWASHSEASASL